MFRKFIEKYYNFIQWTKKWHFFHIIFIISGLASILGIPLGIWATIYDLKHVGYVYDESLYYVIIVPIVFNLLSITLIFCLAIIVEAFILIKRVLARKVFYVLNPFLNKNKFYNKIYTLSATITLGTIPIMFLIAILILIGESIYLYIETNPFLLSLCKNCFHLLFS